jgi:hypothetical protein
VLQASKAFRSSGRFLNAVFTFSDNVEVWNFRCNPLGRKTRFPQKCVGDYTKKNCAITVTQNLLLLPKLTSLTDRIY